MARVLKEESTLKKIVGGLEFESGILATIWKFEIALGAIIMLLGFIWGWFAAGAGAALIFLGIAHAAKRTENVADIGRFKGGAAGENQVTDIMRAGLPESYIILNDLSVRSGVRSAQNDHVVLGPNGIFVVETKAYAGTLTGKATDDYLIQVKSRGGKQTETKLKNPIPQNEYHMKIVGEKMSQGGFVVDDLHSIIVFTNRWARLNIAGGEGMVIKPEMVVSTILGKSSKYSYDEEWLMRLAKYLHPKVTVGRRAQA